MGALVLPSCCCRACKRGFPRRTKSPPTIARLKNMLRSTNRVPCSGQEWRRASRETGLIAGPAAVRSRKEKKT